MKLEELLAYDDIVIQCHDNPDADSLASGFGLYRYLVSCGKRPRLIYGGRNRIRKSNLLMLIKDLEIPVEHVETLSEPELLVTVDCQYNGGNLVHFPAAHVAVLDHHRISTRLPALSEVRSSLGACSTLIWQKLKEAGYDVEGDRQLATALYYGLYTDTNSFTEIVHPLDKDLRDAAGFDPALMARYRNANLSLEELEVAGAALLHSDYIEEYRCAIVKSAPCDPSILGLISDLVLEVDAVDCCLVFNVMPDGVKLSVRSCVREIRANEMASELCKNIGSGGGHTGKAGGFIPMELLAEAYLDFCRRQDFQPRMEMDATGQKEQPTASGIKAVLEWRMKDYLGNADIIYADSLTLQDSSMEEFVHRPIPWGFVEASALFAAGSRINVRTINGDEEMVVEPDTMLIIGQKGEVYAAAEADFHGRYRAYPGWPFALREPEYCPTVKARGEDRIVSIVNHAGVCVPKDSRTVLARQLDRRVKLFRRDLEGASQLGKKGSYLVSVSGSPQDLVIMERELFERTFRRAAEPKRDRTVIFDLDGTLLDTLEDLKNAVNAALAAFEMEPCTLQQVRQYLGNGIRQLMRQAVPGGEENPDFERAFALFKEHYGAHCVECTKPYSNIDELIDELQAQGVSLAVVSNKVDSAVKELCGHFFAGRIDVAIGEKAGVLRKPSPDSVHAALKELGAAKEGAVYVGDSEVDIQTAANAGLACVSVTWGFRSEAFLKESGAQTLIQRPLELLYLV